MLLVLRYLLSQQAQLPFKHLLYNDVRIFLFFIISSCLTTNSVNEDTEFSASLAVSLIYRLYSISVISVVVALYDFIILSRDLIVASIAFSDVILSPSMLFI